MQERKSSTETPVSQQSIDQLMSTKDKTEKFFSKAVAYKKRQFELCHKYDHLLKNLFPELWESR